jgi:hypothetical protein
MSDEELLKLAETGVSPDVGTFEEYQSASFASIAASLLVIARNSGKTKKVFTESVPKQAFETFGSDNIQQESNHE